MAAPEVSENEALIESSFRRLIVSVEAERGRIRSTWQQIAEETRVTEGELDRLKQDTQEWCNAEKLKIESEWKRLDRLKERMSVLFPADKNEVLDINCSGTLLTLPKAALCSIEGSYLNHMFSDAFIQSVPRDKQNRYFLDYHPQCFSVVCDFLTARMEKPELPAPLVSPELQQSMDLLVDALQIKPFLRVNSVSTSVQTSLRISGNIITASHHGWQVVAAQYSLPMSCNAYFEVKILANPDQNRSGLAIGVCGHSPQGTEVHSIRLSDSVLYNSNVGVIGTALALENVQRGLKLEEGCVLGIKHEVGARTLNFFFSRTTNGPLMNIGSCSLKTECLERMRTLFPIFALHVPGQKIQVDFTSGSPTKSTVRSAQGREG